MLHLFNNIFLQQDQYINQYNYNVVLSEKYAIADLTIPNSNPKIIGSGKTVSAAFGENKTIYDMLLILSQLQTKVIIFADSIHFGKILSCWLKSSTNMEKKSYDFFVDCYAYKIKTIYGDVSLDFVKTIKEEWDTSICYDFTSLDFSPSYEFLMASALYDSDFKYKDKFKKLLLKFIKREIENYILEGRRFIDTYIMSNDVQKILGGKINTPADVYLLPKLKLFRLPYWTDDINMMFSGTSYVPGKNSKIDISKASLEELTKLHELTRQIYGVVIFGKQESKLLEFEKCLNSPLRAAANIPAVISNEITDSYYLELLQNLLNADNTSTAIPTDLLETILSSFILYVKELALENNTDLLEFTLK